MSALTRYRILPLLLLAFAFILIQRDAACFAATKSTKKLCKYPAFVTCSKEVDDMIFVANRKKAIYNCLEETGCKVTKTFKKKYLSFTRRAFQDDCSERYQRCQVYDNEVDSCVNYFNRQLCIQRLSVDCNVVENINQVSERKSQCDPEEVAPPSEYCTRKIEECETSFLRVDGDRCDRVEGYQQCLFRVRCPRYAPPESLTEAAANCSIDLTKTCDRRQERCYEQYGPESSTLNPCVRAGELRNCLVQYSSDCLTEAENLADVKADVKKFCALGTDEETDRRCQGKSTSCATYYKLSPQQLPGSRCQTALGHRRCMASTPCPQEPPQDIQKAIDDDCGPALGGAQ